MRGPCVTVGAALVLAVLTGCGPDRVCPPVGWSNTVVVQLGSEWTDLDAASVRVAGRSAVPLTDGSADVWLDMSSPGTVEVTVLDAQGEVLTEREADLDWRRVGGSEECGGPAEATVVVDP